MTKEIMFLLIRSIIQYFYWQTHLQSVKDMNLRTVVFVFLLALAYFAAQVPVLKQNALKPFMFTLPITGDVEPLEPTSLAISPYWPFPVQVYEIAMKRARHRFLPDKFNDTEIFAYAGKINGKFVPSFPGPTLSVLKNMPIYVIWTNDIDGKHILPVDTSPPFDMVAQFQNQVPVVPHAHGLETEMGPDGQPMGFWTRTGRTGPDFFSLKSAKKTKNQAIFRYHNTKEGLFWYHDHAMAITRLNVYAGLVGLYEIIDPQISSQESNILKYYGDIERKYFAIVDKTFRENGELFYPDKAESSNFKSWVPEFFGNTFTVNGKIWPVVTLEPKIYRLVFLNGCQSRFVNMFFEHKNKKLDFEIFRRDSDFLPKPVKVKEHLLLLGGRIQIFLDLTKITGEVMLSNDAKIPSPMGEGPNQFMRKIMKIVVKPPTVKRNLQEKVSLATIQHASQPNDTIPVAIDPRSAPAPADATPGQTFLQKIQNKMDLYTTSTNTNTKISTIDFIDEQQAPNYNPPSQISTATTKKISLVDFINSNDQGALTNLITATDAQSQAIDRTPSGGSSAVQSPTPISLVEQNIQSQKVSLIEFLANQNSQSVSITNVPYPRFGAGKKYFTILADVSNKKDELSSVMIDGVPVKMGCQGSSFKEGEVYDFYIINLTMDDHPIHIHIVNFQVIQRFKFNVKKYRKDWQDKNGQLVPGGIGKVPEQLNVLPYKIPNSEEPPKEWQKQFLDVILVPSQQVTVARVKISNHYGKSFPFSVSGGRYVWHCHILEHEDNEMMRYFCIE